MKDNRYLVSSEEPMDTNTMLAIERCASFVARMIEKYGQEVLDEIEEETTKMGKGG